MKNEKEKSIVRTKKTTISLTDIVLKEGATIIIPYGAPAYELIKLLLKHAKDWYSERRSRRIEEFHEQLLDGISEECQEELFKNEFSIEEYYSILNHVVQDEEDSKNKIYSKLFQALQLNLIPAEYRLHLIKSSRELKYADFDLIRQLYINEKYEFIAPGNKPIQIQSITISDDPIRAHSIQTLIRWGFLSTAETNRPPYKPPWPTQLLKITAELLYDEYDLTDESIGKKAKTAETEKIKIYIACDTLGDNKISPILFKISNYFLQADIKNVIANPMRKSFPLTLSPIIAICRTSKGSPLENIKKHVDLKHKKLIQVILPGGKQESSQMPAIPVFDFTSANEEEYRRLIEFVKQN